MTYKTDSRYQLQVQQIQSGMLVLIKENLQAQRLVSLLPLLAHNNSVSCLSTVIGQCDWWLSLSLD
jgi:hypothetical protein